MPMFRDESGPRLPLGCHFADALARVARGEEGEVLRHLRVIREAGYQFTRVFCETWGDFFYPMPGRDLRVGPGFTPDYYGVYERLLRLHAEAGLKLGHSIGTSQDYGLESHTRMVDHLANLADRHKRVGLEHMFILDHNEPRFTTRRGPAECAELMRIYRGMTGGLVMTSAGEWGEGRVGEDGRNPTYGVDTRGCPVWESHAGWGSPDWWSHTDHIWSAGYEDAPAGTLGYGSEHRGPGYPVSGILISRPTELMAMALAATLSRQAYVYFSGQGLYSHQGEFSDLPAFREIPKVYHFLEQWGADLHTYERLRHAGWNGELINGTVRAPEAVWTLAKGESRRARIDQLISPTRGRAAGVFYGDPGSYPVRLVQPGVETTIVDPMTLESTSTTKEFTIGVDRCALLLAKW